MNDLYELYERIRQLEETIRNLQLKTDSYEALITSLQNDISQLKNAPRTSIEYKFDQLKIETLEGTLNIGFSPGGTGLENIEDLGINDGDFQVNQQTTGTPFSDDMYNGIKQHVDHYLNHDIFNEIDNIKRKSGVKLPESQIKVIVEDIKRQMTLRFPHYLTAVKRDNVQRNPHQEAERIMTQIKKDILTGIEIYMDNERKRNAQGGDHNGA